MINLLSKTSLGRSRHARFQTFGPIWHVSGTKMEFWRNDIMILHHFCRRSSKIKLFLPKTSIFNLNYPKNQKKHVSWASPAKTIQNHLDISSKTFFWTRNVRILPTLVIWTCPDLPRPVHEDKYLLQTSGNTFIFPDFTPFIFLITDFIYLL